MRSSVRPCRAGPRDWDAVRIDALREPGARPRRRRRRRCWHRRRPWRGSRLRRWWRPVRDAVRIGAMRAARALAADPNAVRIGALRALRALAADPNAVRIGALRALRAPAADPNAVRIGAF